jgi:hypothetical protein
MLFVSLLEWRRTLKRERRRFETLCFLHSASGTNDKIDVSMRRKESEKCEL